MGYSLDAVSDHCYPNSTVLINKFDIRDQKKLDEVESVLTSARTVEWFNNPSSEKFDFRHYKEIHHFLFHDLYEWAGKIRTINISKRETRFCKSEDIEYCADLIFERLKECNYFKNLSHQEFVEEIVDFYCVTNSLHPFREGNGRTQRVFLTQLIRNAGYDIQFSKMDTDLLMIATIQASHGVQDLLKQVFSEAIYKK